MTSIRLIETLTIFLQTIPLLTIGSLVIMIGFSSIVRPVTKKLAFIFSTSRVGSEVIVPVILRGIVISKIVCTKETTFLFLL